VSAQAPDWVVRTEPRSFHQPPKQMPARLSRRGRSDSALSLRRGRRGPFYLDILRAHSVPLASKLRGLKLDVPGRVSRRVSQASSRRSARRRHQVERAEARSPRRSALSARAMMTKLLFRSGTRASSARRLGQSASPRYPSCSRRRRRLPGQRKPVHSKGSLRAGSLSMRSKSARSLSSTGRRWTSSSVIVDHDAG
jgi:hypothetical protein